ncbi:MAG: sulfotransferase [Gemmataceae bacterium]|nr:sulfotransferase [Gemmataceae bacterium]
MSTAPKNDGWMPHVWEGADFFTWIRFLRVHHFRVSLRYLWVAAIASIVTFIHSVCWLIQQIFWRHRVRKTPRVTDPIFILGHWRSGTTFLHELLIRDPRHTYPNYYQCLEPNHFLLAERFITLAMPYLLPKRRPMDDLPITWDSPQEDEFALMLMGQPSYYTHIGFPNTRPVDFDWLDFRGISEKRQDAWSAALESFLRQVSFKNPGRRLVLKSPPHTARIPALVRRFPNATFVHIVREPYRLLPSTIKMWTALYHFHTMENVDLGQVEKTVLEAGQRLFRGYEAGKASIPAGRLYELRYEDLMAQPLGEMEKLYRALGLGDFTPARPAIEAYLATLKDYKPTTAEASPDVRAKVDEYWGDTVARYGYARPTLVAKPSPVPQPPANTLSGALPCKT